MDEPPAYQQVGFHSHVLETTWDTNTTKVCGMCGVPIAQCADGDWHLRCTECTHRFCSRCATRDRQKSLKCTVPTRVHPHPLFSVSVPGNMWRCDGDSMPGGCRAATADEARLWRHRCSWCDYDLCLDCLEDHCEGTVATTLHVHRLVPFECPTGDWPCSLCGARAGSGAMRWRCERCDFNLCSADVQSHLLSLEGSSTTDIRKSCELVTPRKSSSQSRANLSSSSPSVAKTKSPPQPPPMPREKDKGPAANTKPFQVGGAPFRGLPKTHVELVVFLRTQGHIRTSAVEEAFLATDRAMFVPEGQSETSLYSGSSIAVDHPRFVLRAADHYAESLEELAQGIQPDDAILVVAPGSGYMTCLCSLLVPQGVCCSIDLKPVLISFAKQCTSRFLGQCKGKAGMIQHTAGNCFSLDPMTNKFHRIHVDVNCPFSRISSLVKLLKVGGKMTCLVSGRLCVYEKESPSSTKKRDIKRLQQVPVYGGTIKFPPFAYHALKAPSSPPLRGDPPSRSTSPKAPDVVSFQEILQKVAGSRLKSSLTGSNSCIQMPVKEENIEEFLKRLELEKYLGKFQEEEITMKNLHLLTDADLKAMGLLLGPRRSIANELARLAIAAVASPHLTPANAAVSRTQDLINAIPYQPIGSGSFGIVWRGVWGGVTPVAMKTLVSGVSLDLENEIGMLRELRHPNILQYYGLAEKDGTFYMVMELASGSVLDLLQLQGDQLGLETLLGMALSCAAGMCFLGEKKIIHRDLAARNLLYFRDGDVYSVKVADFGLAKALVSGDYYMMQQSPLCPVKWTSIEALAYRKFSTMSDVWSFGVVLWEIMAGGIEPYTGIPASQIFELLQRGERLPLPENCPQKVYDLMRTCWVKEPAKRPTFKDIYESIDAMLEGAAKTQQSVPSQSCSTELPEGGLDQYNYIKLDGPPELPPPDTKSQGDQQPQPQQQQSLLSAAIRPEGAHHSATVVRSPASSSQDPGIAMYYAVTGINLKEKPQSSS